MARFVLYVAVFFSLGNQENCCYAEGHNLRDGHRHEDTVQTENQR